MIAFVSGCCGTGLSSKKSGKLRLRSTEFPLVLQGRRVSRGEHARRRRYPPPGNGVAVALGGLVESVGVQARQEMDHRPVQQPSHLFVRLVVLHQVLSRKNNRHPPALGNPPTGENVPPPSAGTVLSRRARSRECCRSTSRSAFPKRTTSRWLSSAPTSLFLRERERERGGREGGRDVQSAASRRAPSNLLLTVVPTEYMVASPG